MRELDLASATAALFAPHVGSAFALVVPDHGAVELRLVAVDRGGAQPNAPRVEPFTLTFAGPERPRLAQAIYRLEHHDLGVLDLFLVPVGYDADSRLQYEAVFN